MIAEPLAHKGWAAIPPSPDLLDWVHHVAPLARNISEDAEHRVRWLRHGGTWFAGVNCLGAAPDGSVAGGPPIDGPLAEALNDLKIRWNGFDAGQISVCYPGYPMRDPDETEAASRFRRNRDAAHVDGLHRRGNPARRYLGERHAFILGIPMETYTPQAAPMVVWEGSHSLISSAITRRLRGVDPSEWDQVDLTDDYVAARRLSFDTCPRVPLLVPKGGAYVVHRWAVHGVAPWQSGPSARSIIYFRPYVSDDWETYPGVK